MIKRFMYKLAPQAWQELTEVAEAKKTNRADVLRRLVQAQHKKLFPGKSTPSPSS